MAKLVCKSIGGLIAAALALASMATMVRAQQPFQNQMQPFGQQSFFASPFEPERPRARVIIHARPAPLPQAAFCVRTCDGRYFPYPGSKGDRDVKACDAVCPSSEMKLYSGSEINTATSEQGKPYLKLANAFRFQRETVASCSCNARTGFGLTRISIENDGTLRSGDIVAESRRLMVATVAEGARGKGRIVFRPLSADKVRALGLTRASLR